MDIKKVFIAVLSVGLVVMIAAAFFGGDISLKSAAKDEPAASSEEEEAKAFAFETTDINGDPVSLTDYADAKVIMVNMWEPWCGPCVNEMPDIERLYQEYKDQGFLVLGVFATVDGDEDAKWVIRSTGVTYPILHASEEFVVFNTGYVPTTVFMDSEGWGLTENAYVGSKSYEDWKAIIEDLLSK